jgi:hypothetical protein
LAIEIFQAADQVEDFAARVGAAGGGAEMGAAAEGAILVDEAAAVLAQERAIALARGGQRLAPGGADGLRGDERLAAGELRRFAGQAELAALGAAEAGAFDRPGVDLAVDGADFSERFAPFGRGAGGGVGAVVYRVSLVAAARPGGSACCRRRRSSTAATLKDHTRLLNQAMVSRRPVSRSTRGFQPRR